MFHASSSSHLASRGVPFGEFCISSGRFLLLHLAHVDPLERLLQLVHVGVPGPQLAAREAAAVVHEVGEVLSLETERAVVRVVCAGLGTEGRASDD